MFRRLIRIFIMTKKPSVLGRWTITDMKKNKIKIDWANVDHCGTCSYEVKNKPEIIEVIEVKPKTK